MTLVSPIVRSSSATRSVTPRRSAAARASLAVGLGLALSTAMFGCAATGDASVPAPAPGALSAGVSIAPGDVVSLTVWGMSCPKCVSNVDQLVGDVDGVTSVETDMSQGIVVVETGATAPTAAALEAAIADAGFTLMKIEVFGAGR